MKSQVDGSLDFFRSAFDNFQTALSCAGEIRRFYRLAGFTICLKFAGDAMVEPLTAALGHLEVELSESWDYSICIWDGFSTKTPLLSFPWAPNRYALRGEVLGYDCVRVHTVVDIHTRVLHLFDREENLGLYWISDFRRLPWWINGSPLQLHLHWWMQTRGYQLTHAASVGDERGGILLAGKGGSGKSTTALACMREGMKYVSEDYCLLSPPTNEVWAYSVYNSAKLEENTLRWFPQLKEKVVNPNRNKEEKAFLFHHEFQPEKLLLGCPLKALVALKIGEGSESRLEPLSHREAVTALSVSTMWQLTHTGPVVFDHLKRVAEKLPCYRLLLGTDLTQGAQIIGSLL
jgi:hypothetical protein